MKSQIKQSSKLLKILLSAIILIISLRYIGKIYQPTLLDDEFAYFGIARYFSGTSWASAMSLCKYYSYGYSLLLVPFVMFIKDTVLLYRLVTAMNGIFLVVAFWLIDSFFRQASVRFRLSGKGELQKEDCNRIAVVSFLMVLLPCNMNYAAVALPECLLLMLFALMLKLMMGLNRDSGCLRYGLLGAIMIYSYMVHQRMLGVLIAALLVFVIKFVKKQIKSGQFLSFTVAAGLLLILHTLLKTDIKENLWMNGILSGQNDMSGILVNIRQIFSSFSYFVKFIVSIFGKMFYMGSSTYLLGFMGIMICVLLILPGKSRKIFSDQQSGEEKPGREEIAYGILFLLLSFLMVLGISAVFMNIPENMAFLLYGRYLETFSPFLMGMGILVLMAERNNIKANLCILLSGALVYGVIGLTVRFFSKRWNLSWLNYISTGQLYRYLIGDSVPVLRIMLAVFATAGMIYFVLRVRRFRGTARILLAVLMFVLFYQTAYIPMHAVNLELQEQRHETSAISGVIREYVSGGKGESAPVLYYVAEEEPDDTAQYRDYVQYWLNDIYLECVSEDSETKWENLAEGTLILVSCKNSQELELFRGKEMKQVYENEICRMYRVGTEQKEDIFRKPA
ncbi:MAG: hypothetical protein HFI34_09590 [Lachnospiraceae bacterium]|nr:hypothetical protein [Lachnospiraceae bacterium]